MLKEHTTVDYVCRIANILSSRSGPVSAGDIGATIGASQSYVCKVLSRMSRSGILQSGMEGYELARPLDQLSVADVLRVCHVNDLAGPASTISDRLMGAAAGIPLGDVL